MPKPKQADHLLKEQQLQEIVSHFPVKYLSCDKNGNVIAHQAESEEFMLALKADSMVYSDLRAKCNAVFHVKKEETYEIDLQGTAYRVQIAPSKNKQAVYIAAVPLVTKFQNPLELVDRGRRYQNLVEGANDIIYTSAPNGIFTYANPIAVEKFEFSLEELQSKHFTDLISKEAQPDAIEFYQAQFSQGDKSSYYEFPGKSKSGKTIWLGQHVKIHRSGDTILGFSAVARDITERKKLENELIEARIKAEESSRAKELFLANMSHELRTPINAIVGFARLLEQTRIPAEARQFVDSITKSGENLTGLVSDILDLSKIEAGQIEIEKIPCNVKHVCEQCHTSLKQPASNQGIEFDFEWSSSLHHHYNCDPLRLTQILTNLLSNAIKFTKSGSVKLIVSEGVNSGINFRVVDTGIGIPEDQHENIFENFRQADSTVTRKFGGTGLGLSITRQLVDLMEGSLTLKSELNIGTQFDIYLPLEKCEANSIKGTQQVEEEYDLSGIRVLLAEDNKFNQLLATTILSKMGLEVSVVQDGLEAIKKLKSDTFDIVLMDMQMPELDGVSATQKIRENKIETPIIAVTANALKGDREKCINAGMNDYITKPYKEEVLFQKIAQFTHRSKSRKERSNVKLNLPSTSYFSLNKLKGLGAKDPTFIANMLYVFLQHTPKMIENLEAACQESDFDKITKIGHKLKSSYQTFEIKHLYKVLDQTENRELEYPRDIQLAAASELVPESFLVLAEMQEVLDILRQ